jgi:4-hydroxybenzoate polyprenyltransferase
MNQPVSSNSSTNSTVPRLKLYLQLIRWDKPVGWLLLLWPTLWALWIAATYPDAGGVPGAAWPPLHLIVIFVLGTILMRSAGCAVNDTADRDFDKLVKRTVQRPVTAGLVSPKEALLVGAALALAAFGLVLFTNALTIQLSFAALLIAASYPFFKRFFPIPQLMLGVAFSFGIPMAFAAVQGTVPPLAWLIFAANMAWTLAFDTAYAMVDKDDDAKIGIKTSALTFGAFDAQAVLASHALFVALLAAVLWIINTGWLAWAGLAVALMLCIKQWPDILSRDRMRCFNAFVFNNWVGMAVFLGIALDRLSR